MRCVTGPKTTTSEYEIMADRCPGVTEAPIVQNVCSDVMVNGAPWFDADEGRFTCSDYEAEEICETDGKMFRNFGHTANTACCACGGGQKDSIVFGTVRAAKRYCKTFKCGAKCRGICGWSKSKGKCKYGAKTTTSELELGKCSSAAHDFPV